MKKVNIRRRRRTKKKTVRTRVAKDSLQNSLSENSITSSVTPARTEKKFNKKSFAIATLRRASYRLRSRNQAMTEARVERGRYKCAKCLGVFGRKEIAVDHVIPVVGPEGFINFDIYIDRMFPDSSKGFQILCRAQCHRSKTLAENQERKALRDAQKPPKASRKKKT